jgi:hypothetical protein
MPDNTAWFLPATRYFDPDPAQRHILYVETPFASVLSWAPPMYAELWTGGKAVYKLEPVVADGGELIINAPPLDVVSLGYLDPAKVHPQDWRGREAEGMLFVPRAGEMLYRLRPESGG